MPTSHVDAKLLELTQRLAKVGAWSFPISPESQVYWTRGAYEIYEYEASSPPSLAEVLERILPQYRQTAIAMFQRSRDGQVVDFEIEIITYKGNHRWLRLLSEPEYDDQGIMVSVAGAVQDISQQKFQEQEQRLLAERLFITLECMTDAFFMLDSQCHLVYVNSAALEFGRNIHKSVLGAPVWDVYPDFVRGALKEGVQNAIAKNITFHIEFYSESIKCWIELDAYPSPQGVAVFFHSINEKKLLADRVAASEKRLRYVTQATLDAAFDWDLEANRIWFSGALVHLLGLNDVEGQDMFTDSAFWYEQIHADDRDRISQSLERMLLSDQSRWQETYHLIHRDGHSIPVEHKAVVLRRDDGLALQVVGGITDITSRLEVENRALQSQRLESIGQLTGHVAHDFNNLLTVILGNAELLQTTLQAGTRQIDMATAIASAAVKGSELTRRLLAFARKQTLEPTSTDLNALVASMHNMLDRTLGVAISIEVQHEPDLPTALVDAHQLEGALLNLCLNARDAMSEGGRLVIATSQVEIDEHYVSQQQEEIKAGRYVVLSITDTGIGISPENLGRIFEPFFSTKPQGKGTGLGLSSVFGFIKQSNGHISVYSELDSGTTVRLYLPVATAGTPARPVVSDSRKGGSETILVVDDEPQVREIARKLLANSLGYTVYEVADGKAALTLLESGVAIDLVFTDVMMPGMNGHELAAIIRRRWPQLPILFTSGFTQNPRSQDDLIEDGYALLSKPYTLSALARKIREMFDA